MLSVYLIISVISSIGHSNKGGSGGDHVVVGNLPWDASWQELKDLARQCCANNGGADVLRADVPVNDAGRSRGFGVLEFASAADAATAIRSMNGVEFKGDRSIICKHRIRFITGSVMWQYVTMYVCMNDCRAGAGGP